MLFGSRDPDPGRDVATWTHTSHTLSQEPELKSESQNVIREDVDEVIGCTQPNCTCECFQPGRVNLRSCDRCKHGWVAHAVSKLSAGAVQCSGQVEIVQCSVVFDISTLLLYGTQAVPVRMKILLDRLFSVLTHTQVITILHTLGWTLRDYIRGYILQDSMGKVLDRWVIMTPEDEVVTLQQFLRFGETKSIVELMAVQEHQDHLATTSRTTKSDSDIRLFIESSSHHLGRQRDTTGDQTPPSLHHFENLPGGNLAFLHPFQYSSQSTSSLISSSTLLQEVSAVACRLQQTLQDHGTDSSEPVAPLSGSQMALTGKNTVNEKITQGLQLHCKLDNSVSMLGKPSNKLQSNIDTDTQTMLGKGERPGTFSCSSSSVKDRGLGLMVRKGRVSCSACGKTFYDKGTLKIHYNAVHLKIKHRCTIEGCNMVFSSLRSRNRHSANPNPRLHTPALRNTHSPQHQLPSAQPCATVLPSRIKPPLDVAPLGIPSLCSSVLEAPHTPLMLSSIKAVQPVPPFYSTLLSSRSSSTSNSMGVSKTDNGTSMIDQTLKQQQTSFCEGNNKAIAQQTKLISMVNTVPKKKPRKSSMPVKIKRETLNEQDHREYIDNVDDGEDNNYDSDDGDEGSRIEAYHINGLVTTQHSSQTSIQPSNELKLSRFHSYNSHNGYFSRRPSHKRDGHEVYMKDSNKTCVSKIKHIVHNVQKTHRTSSCFNSASLKENAASEKNRGVMEKRMRREGQSRREEKGEPFLKVKEEVYDPSYDLHCSRHCDFNNWENRGVVAVTSAVISDLQKDFNTSSDQEEEEDGPDDA